MYMIWTFSYKIFKSVTRRSTHWIFVNMKCEKHRSAFNYLVQHSVRLLDIIYCLCGKHGAKFEAMLESRVASRFLVITLIDPF